MQHRVSPSANRLALVAVAAVASLVLAACGSEPATEPETGSPAAAATTSAQSGGSVTYALDAEPTVLNPVTIDGNSTATGHIVVPVLWSLWHITPEGEHVPALLDGEPEVTEDPFSVTYRLRDEATWSDGTPITAEDVAFTVEIKQNPDLPIATIDGYDRITGVEVIDEKTITLTFDGPYPQWRALFAGPDTPILPAHVLDAETFEQAWTDGITGADGEPIASGPFVVESWERGQNLILARNDAFWGEPAKLDQVVVKFVPDTGTQVQQLRGGEVDVLYPAAQIGLVDSLADVDAFVEVVDGPTWEHITFNLAVEPLDRVEVRRGIAHAIDRDALAEVALEGVAEEPTALDALFAAPEDDGSGPFDRYDYDVDEALASFEAAGCDVSGVASGGQVTCDGEPLELRYTTTAGDEGRQLVLEVVQAQLAEVGVSVVADVVEPGVMFSPERLFGGPDGAWDLIVFSWSTGLDPLEAAPAWMCETSTNFQSYCSDELDDLVNEAGRVLDEDERAGLVAQAENLLAEELPVLPLYRAPQPTVWRPWVQGVEAHPLAIVGPLWNVQEWTLAAE